MEETNFLQFFELWKELLQPDVPFSWSRGNGKFREISWVFREKDGIKQKVLFAYYVTFGYN